MTLTQDQSDKEVAPVLVDLTDKMNCPSINSHAAVAVNYSTKADVKDSVADVKEEILKYVYDQLCNITKVFHMKIDSEFSKVM